LDEVIVKAGPGEGSWSGYSSVGVVPDWRFIGIGKKKQHV